MTYSDHVDVPKHGDALRREMVIMFACWPPSDRIFSIPEVLAATLH